MKQTFENNGADKRVYSNIVKAGQRTYFFDVKINRFDQYYLIITESKKRIDQDGKPVFDKFKIHLYHESVNEFSRILKEMTDFILKNNEQPAEICEMADSKVI